jgi:hypothetical protein
MTDTPKIPTVKDAIIAVASAQFSDLLRAQFGEVTKDALKTFADTEDEGEPKCRVAFAVSWNPNASAPKVEGRLSWTVRKVHNTEDVADPNQLKFPADVIGGDGRGAA